MEVEAEIYVENETLEEAEAKLMNNLKQLQKVPRNVVLAYAGFWGMAYDEAKSLVGRSREIFERAEDKGEEIESETMAQVRQVYKRAEEEVEETLDELDVPTPSRMERLSLKIDALDQKLDVVVAREADVESEVGRRGKATDKRLAALEAKLDRLAEKVEQVILLEAEEEAAEPLPGYDNLTAKEIVKALAGLNIAQLVAVRQYELAGEQRVTVLRAADERIEAMPIPHYDELTVDEIEPLLSTLGGAELSYLSEYEAARENRVTLLRAIESELEARAEA